MRICTLSTILLGLSVVFGNSLTAQNVGIGIATPAAKLEVDGGFAVSPVTVPAAAAIAVPVNESVMRIANDGANVAIAVAAPASATEGQFLSIRNEDATNIATFAGTAIPAGQMAEFIFLNGGWRFRTGTAGTDWTLAGNAGTVPGTNFIGTTDNVAFQFRVLNQWAGALTPNGPTSFGHLAGAVNTNAYLVAIGRSAGATNTTGQNNTVVGSEAFMLNSTGNGNAAVGFRAMRANSVGSANTAMGNQALEFNSIASNNSAFGLRALYNTTGDNNTAIGYFAGVINTTGTLNTFLGTSSNALANNLTNATAIGANARVDASNALVLGSVNGINAAVATANVGIGLNAPTARLHINGAYANTFTSLAAGAAPAVANNLTHVRLTDDAAAAANAIVGPGTPVDGQVLTIVNNDAQAATFAGTTIAATIGAASFVYANGAWRVYGNSLGDNLGNHIATTQIQSTLGTAAAPGYSLVGDLNTGLFSPGADQMSVSTAGTERMRVDAAGNLGLGFPTPAYRIDIANAATGGIRIQDNGFTGFPNGYQFLTIGDDAYFSDVDVANTTALYGLANPDRAGLYFGSSGALIFGIAGNFGIGNNTPSARLDVTGEIQIASTGATAAAIGAGGLRWDGTNIQYSNGAAWVNMLNGNTGWQLAGNTGTGAELLGTTNGQPLRIITNNAERMRVDAAGLVGIGTTTPAEQLHVFGAANAGVVIDGSLAGQSRISIRSAGTERSVIYRPGGSTDLRIYGAGLGNDIIHFGATTGNVGIGVTAPTARLEVNGGTAGVNARLGAGTGWAGNSYPTLSGTTAEQWIMIHNPHVPYLQNGINGYAGATTGAQIRMAGNTAAGAVWDMGILGSLGSDRYGIARGGVVLTQLDNTGRVGLNTGTAAQYRLNVYNQQLTANGDGQADIYDFRTRDSQNDGFGYGIGQTNTAMTGYNFWGDLYTFGLHGATYGDYTRTGGVLGSAGGTTSWASIGYKASNSVYYATYGSAGYANGGGYSPADAEQNAGVGIGAYGGVMGGWVRGDVMGFATAGEVYASYNLGNEYTSGHSADIVTTADGQRHAAFANTSTSLKVYTDGRAELANGTAYVPFPAEFRALIAAGQEPTVTVSPSGESNGIYVLSVDANGFTIRENANGTHNVRFSWIAIGTRLDAPANNALPGVVARPDFDDQMRGVMFNENNHEQSATPVWYDGQGVRFDEVPASLSPSKPEGTLSPDDLRHQESQRQQGATAPAPQE